MKRISLTAKHFLVYLSICLVTIVAIAAYSYFRAREALLVRTFEQLTSVRIEKSNSVKRFFDDRIRDVEMISSAEVIDQYFMLSEKLEDPSRMKDSVFFTFLDSYLKSGDCYRRIILVGKGAEARYVTGGDNANEKAVLCVGDSTFTNAIRGLVYRIKLTATPCFQDYVYSDNQTTTMFVGAPVFRKNTKTIAGVVILEIDVSSLNELMYEDDPQYGLGETGEAYIVGSDYKIRTASRFQDNSIFRTRVETAGVVRALAGETSTDIVNDYRGVPVLSSFSRIQIGELNWVILAEIDKEEAMHPIVSLRYDIFWLACIITFLMSGVVYIISRRMTMPVVRLRQAVTHISKGDYTQHLEVSTRDEIGALTEAFNHMVSQLVIQSAQIKEARLKRISSMLDGQESERQRLSRDLHDSLGQSILAVKMKLEQAKQGDNESRRKSLTEALALIKIVIQEIRAITHDLMPPVLAAFGLEKGLKNLCREASNSSEINILFEAEGDFSGLDSKEQIYLYRIAQEAIQNIIKHSGATQALIRIDYIPGSLKLYITDNGKGFDISNPDIRANGINNMMERVELIGGHCTFASEPGKGTTIQIEIQEKHV